MVFCTIDRDGLLTHERGKGQLVCIPEREYWPLFYKTRRVRHERARAMLRVRKRPLRTIGPFIFAGFSVGLLIVALIRHFWR